MANELKATGTPAAGTMTAVLIRADGYIWDTNLGDYAATPTAANMAITMTEVGSTGRYLGSLTTDQKTAAPAQELKVEYADIVPGSFAFGTAIVERQVIYMSSPNISNIVLTPAVYGESISIIETKLPSASASMAGEGTTAKNLDQVVAGAGGQPRINKPAGRAFRRSISSRADGTHAASAPVRVRVGAVGSIAVGLDMMPLFGSDLVVTVGTPTVVPSGEITATASGPRDTEAMVILGGTSTASSTYTVTVPVTMDTGESVDVDFDVETFAN